MYKQLSGPIEYQNSPVSTLLSFLAIRDHLSASKVIIVVILCHSHDL